MKFRIHSFRQSCLLEKVIIAAAAMVLGLVISLACHTIGSYAAQSDTPVKVYTSVRICKGDTLNDIARTFYSPSRYDTFQDAVHELKEINSLRGDGIREGAYLVVPEYID